MLVDETSLGPFRYQHVFLTGSAPTPFLLHHEAQTQIYYRLKAAYFHASLFVDPSLFLVGYDSYTWRVTDFGSRRLDDRLNESFFIELGFDFGPLAIEIVPVATGHHAFKVGPLMAQSEVVLFRAGARLTGHRYQVEALAGLTTQDGEKHRYGRLNLDAALTGRVRGSASVIYRTVRVTGAFGAGADDVYAPIASFSANVASGALSVGYDWSRRITTAVMATVERQGRRGEGPGGPLSSTGLFPTFALYNGFAF